jgi:hypothetical protein
MLAYVSDWIVVGGALLARRDPHGGTPALVMEFRCSAAALMLLLLQGVETSDYSQ